LTVRPPQGKVNCDHSSTNEADHREEMIMTGMKAFSRRRMLQGSAAVGADAATACSAARFLDTA